MQNVKYVNATGDQIQNEKCFCVCVCLSMCVCVMGDKEGKRGRSRSCSYVNRCIGSSREEENCQLFVSASADMMWQRPDGHKVLQKKG